jgi:WD40-like Beta Propeller Repeat
MRVLYRTGFLLVVVSLGFTAFFVPAAVRVSPEQHGHVKFSGPYFGQKPPGKAAEPFGLDIPGLHQTLHSALIFSPDGKEAYWKPGWNPREPVYISRNENGRWTAHAVAPFSAPEQGDDSPLISPDGSYLLFTRSQQPAKLYISYPKKDGTWTPGRDLSEIIKSDISQMPFVTADGKYLFFTIGGRIQWIDAGFIEELRPKE